MIRTMPLVRDRCFCVRKLEYSETSQILTLFGRENGLLRLIAKGAHRRTKAGAGKFDGGIDLLDVGDAVFSHAPERELPPLTEWKLVEGHLSLRRSLRGMYLGQYAAELLTTLFEEHDPHPPLWDRAVQTIAELGGDGREERFLSFQLDLLRESGYVPVLDACAACGRAVDERARAYFSPSHGGVICANCESSTPDRMEIDPRLLRLVNGILRLPRVAGEPQRLPRLTRHQTDPLNRMLADHVRHTTGRALRMPAYVLASPRRQVWSSGASALQSS